MRCLPTPLEKNMISHWKTIKTEYLVRDRWLSLRADTCLTGDGVRVDPYYVLEYPDWTHVVALDHDNRVLITRQYRHAVGMICTEIPGGEIEEGELPIEGARRELLEETGCTAELLEPVSEFYPNPARQNNRVHSFLARNVVQTEDANPDEAEDIQCEFIPIPELIELVDTGEIHQSLHVASIFMALKKCGLVSL